jgi:hypothetical protein
MALVGFTRSYNDLQWLEMARVWAAAHEPAMAEAWATARQKVFDLRGEAGRNFLDHAGEYEVVVLFAIYNPPADSPDFRKALGRRRGQTSLALNHSRERWAHRLSATRAKVLFVFRREDSVDGRWLGDIDGYEKLPEESGVFGLSIYRRVNVSHL